MKEMLQHLTRAIQKTSTHNYLAERYGEDTIAEARSMGWIGRTLKGGHYFITLSGRRELGGEE